jgi:hypothetical protein
MTLIEKRQRSQEKLIVISKIRTLSFTDLADPDDIGMLKYQMVGETSAPPENWRDKQLDNMPPLIR